MKVFIIHHLEPMWQDGYSNVGKTTFEELQERFVEFLAQNDFDHVILTRFEDWEADERDGYFYEFRRYVSAVHPYAYGWDKECMEGNEDRFCEGGNHSEYVLIDDWMIKLRGCDVTISGAFDGDHCIGVHPATKSVGGVTFWWIDDPLCPTGRWERASGLGWSRALGRALSMVPAPPMAI